MTAPAAGPRGIVVATLTPYDAEGRVDAGLAREHAAWLAEQGVPGLAPVGTTGEALYLEEAEKRRLIRAVVEGAAGRARVVAGIWALSPAEVARLAADAADAGADALFLTTPIYYRYGEAAILEWYRHAARAARLPLFGYHIPAYTGNDVSLEMLETLIGEGTLAGIKDSTGNAERLAAEIRVAAGRAAVYGASDSFALQAARLGPDGFISALANIFPDAFLRIWEGDEEAQKTMDRARSAVKGYGGIAALKQLLRRRGFEFGATRLPFSELDAAGGAALDELMSGMGRVA